MRTHFLVFSNMFCFICIFYASDFLFSCELDKHVYALRLQLGKIIGPSQSTLPFPLLTRPVSTSHYQYTTLQTFAFANENETTNDV